MNKVTGIIRIVCYNYSNSNINKSILFKNSSLFRPNLPQLVNARYYAKNKDKKKEDKGKGVKKHVKVDETFLNDKINFSKLNEDMEKSVRLLNENLTKYVSVRSTLGSIENVPVKFNSRTYKLVELGQVVRKNSKVLAINMRSFPQAIMDTLKALAESGMNLNPQQEGTTIYVPVPRVTREYREELIKNAKSLFIKSRDNIRDVQNKCIKSLKLKEKQGALSQDDFLEASTQVKFIGDIYIIKAQKLLEEKQEELLGGKDDSS
ncbi:hypothetical protein O3M35_002348 [Rhynocoris fuscipes]|uniref:Ribosome-recycling factor, mitochondrial n=1 Tax=Rhynocoris fuscipes TaxID=488301 RepID=A0AAW1CL81_9HEMI